MAQDFGFTVALGKQAHSRLRSYFASASVREKDKSDSGIIEFSFVGELYKTDPEWLAPTLWKSEFPNVLALYLRKDTITLEKALHYKTPLNP